MTPEVSGASSAVASQTGKPRGFLGRQVKEIREGGFPVLLRKARWLANDLLRPAADLVALILVLVIRALRPLVVIRIGALASNRIGHYAFDTELYLCQRDAGLTPRRAVDIFYNAAPVCNQQLRRMWERTLRVWPYVAVLDRMNRRLPGGQAHQVVRRSWESYSQDMHRLIALTQPHLRFTPEEERLGRELLRQMGIPEGDSYVCFHARDSAYLDVSYPGKDWRYHDYRDSDVANYVPAAKELARRGYHAIRMGSVVGKSLPHDLPMVIDYATKCRTDFLDLFLIAHSEFYLGSHDGLFTVAPVFRRPVALVNVVPIDLAPTWAENYLFIPKLLWLRREGRFMTFREIFDSEASIYDKSEDYENAGIELVENSAVEIAELAIEMEERLRGAWQTTSEDDELQSRFWSVFKHARNHGPMVSRIGTAFLRRHSDLLPRVQ